MKTAAAAWRTVVKWGGLSFIPALFLLVVQWLSTGGFPLEHLAADWLFTVGVLLLALVSAPQATNSGGWVWPWAGVCIGAAGALAGVVYYLDGLSTMAAWGVVVVAWAILLGLENLMEARSQGLKRGGLLVFFAVFGATLPVLASQIESRFSEEEFFAALQFVVLAVFWLLVRWVFIVLKRKTPLPSMKGVVVAPRWVGILLAGFGVVGLIGAVRVYQGSFFPQEAPAFPGISSRSPFLCGTVEPDSRTYEGKAVFQQMLALVEANPQKAAPEYALLALGTGEESWAGAFREQILKEADEQLFTQPANSVKFDQYLAGQRAYFYPKVRETFPELFTAEEEARLQTWFAAINQRAQTVEWVDWAYGIAMGYWPQGPYENQENGAGLLSLLEANGLGAPLLTAQNQAYLDENPRGWATRFRVTDDAALYQPEWIENAWYQSLYRGAADPENMRLSFEWLRNLALPDGAPLGYNHPGATSMGTVGLLGAHLLKDDEYLWLAGNGIERLTAEGGFLAARPGMEFPLQGVGHSPTVGSCLMYGDSGLPTRGAPLAPDKIVFRSGWGDQDTYLLLNLRFSGWHRYKATNVVTLLYQQGAIAVEDLTGERFGWLPEGRSLFRDKRVPRENLNGLVVGRTGMSAVVFRLSGMGSPWAQDPPFYATVTRFETSPERDVATVLLNGWRGWRHERTVYFYHDGPVVVVDSASGPSGAQAALTWNVKGENVRQNGMQITIERDTNPVGMVWLPPDGINASHFDLEQGKENTWRLWYKPIENGKLEVVTVFLPGGWAAAQVETRKNAEKWLLGITNGDKTIQLSLPFGVEH